VGDEVVDRTAGLAERHAAIHAAGALLPQLLFGKVLVNLKPVVHTLEHGSARGHLPGVVHESGGLTHAAAATCWPKPRRLRPECMPDRSLGHPIRACIRAGRL